MHTVVNDFRQHKKYRERVFRTKREIEDMLYAQGITKIYYVLSFGGGTQSTHLFEQMLQGKRHYDFVIMSDVGAEPEFIHNKVDWWRNRQKKFGNTTPFIITHHNQMDKGLEEMLMRYIHTDYLRFQMPLYFNHLHEITGEEIPGGIMKRQCTTDFKITPVQQTVRRMVLHEYGLGDLQHMPKHIAFIMDLGFSYDEINRVNHWQSTKYKYMYRTYPLVEEGITTDDSIQFLIDNNMPIRRSRCYFCPFNCDKLGMSWQEIIDTEPLSFLKACYFDEELRRVQKTGSKNMRSVPYFHYTRKPS
jgi:hypothetical protein